MLALYWNQLSAWLKAKDDRGATMVEYALLVALIAVVAIVVISIVGQQTSSAFDTVGQSMSGANN